MTLRSSTTPIEIFICYARRDEALLNDLKMHLALLQRAKLIDLWYDREINAGAVWKQEIDKHLSEAQIILLLVSPDFMFSDYCYSIEMKQALDRHKRGEARVVPVILRPVHWEDILGDLQALPRDAKPVTTWQDKDEALYNVAEGIRDLIKKMLNRPLSVSTQRQILAQSPRPKEKGEQECTDTDDSLLSNLSSDKGEEFTTMAEAFRAVARQRSKGETVQEKATDIETLKQQFHQAMVELYRDTFKSINYRATQFSHMVDKYGGNN